MRPVFYLASASPRRARLLEGLGFNPRVLALSVDESAVPGESPARHVERLACAKCRAARPDAGPGVVLAADTAVVVDGDVLGKPGGPQEARAMLQRLSGREHLVYTGVCLRRTDDGQEHVAHRCTAVRFRDVGAEEIDAYVETGEPQDKAGAYGIQGLGVFLVDGIDGSWSNVVGLPLEPLPVWLRSLGFDPWRWVTR